MRRKLVTAKPAVAAIPATRVAWWAAFLTTIVLVLCLSAVRSAKAAILPPVGPLNVPSVFEPDEGDEEDAGEESEAEDCESSEEEGEEDEGGAECEDEEVEFGTPPECLLASADAAVSTDLDHGKVRLAVRYEADTPATVAVDYSLRGSKGALDLKGDEKHFGPSGVFRLTQSLTPAEAKKVAAAKSFTVTVRPVNTPRSCSSYLDQHLSVRQAAPGGVMWVDSESTFRRARRH